MVINFKVEQQTITRLDSQRVISDSKNYLYAAFNFSAEWTGIITAQFTRVRTGNRFGPTYDVVVQNNQCLVPWEVLTGSGIVELHLFCGDLITSDPVTFTISASGLKDGQLPSEPTPGYFQQVLDYLAKDFKGDVGPQGPQGEIGPQGPQGEIGDITLYRRTFVGDFPTLAEIESMNEGDVWFVLGDVAVSGGTVILSKSFTGADGTLSDVDFTSYRDSGLNVTTHGLTYAIAGNKLSLKTTNSLNAGTGNVREFGVRTSSPIAMPSGTERLVIEYEQGPENVIGATSILSSPNINIIDATQWPSTVTYSPYFSSGITNAITLYGMPDLSSGNVASTLRIIGGGSTTTNISVGDVEPYSLPTMAKMKITLTATTIKIEKNDVVLATEDHNLAGKNIHIGLGNGMYANGQTIDVQFDNLMIVKYAV